MSRKIEAKGKSIDNREITLLASGDWGRTNWRRNHHLKSNKIADILTKHSLSIIAPAVNDLNDLASILFVKENISPNEFFNFSLASET